MSWLSNIEGVIQKDEQWVVAEIRKGWTLVQNAEHQAEIDILNVFHWISAHQQDALTLLHNVLTDITAAATVAGAVFPQFAAPISASVIAATTAINAGTAAINVLARGIQQGSTPISTVANAYQASKSAVNAVNDVLKHATTQQASTPAAAPSS